MYGEKRAKQIEYKARKQRESLAGVSNTAPLNVQVRLRAYCMIWELKQKGKAVKGLYEADRGLIRVRAWVGSFLVHENNYIAPV